jgi:drug/metabolite transporter (DMT)-like permease
MFSISRSQNAIVLMLWAMFCLSVMNVTLRILCKDMHFTQIVVLRHLCSIAIVLAWTAWLARGRPDFKSRRMSGHFWRATFGICAMEMWFYSITIMPLTIATALSFSTPIFSTILAIIFLGEKAGIRRWSAIMTGFIGMLIILRPDINGISNEGWIVIGASLLMAGSGVMVKSLTSSEKPETIVFYMAVFMLIWSLPPAFPHWQAFTLEQFGLAFIIGLCSTSAHLLMARAFMSTELVVLMPFDFMRLVFTAILAYLFFGEMVDSYTILGSAVIVISTVYIAHREAKKKKQLDMVKDAEGML